MAAYSTDFSGYTTGIQPADWTARWNTDNSTWTVQDDAGAEGGKVLQHTATASAYRLLSWDDIDADAGRAEVEILSKFESTSSTASQFLFIGRASGAGGSETGYHAELRNWSGYRLRLLRLVSGSATILVDDTSIVFNANVTYWIRFRISGTDPAVRLQVRYWEDGSAEPGTWNIDHSDSSASRITTAGWVGVGNQHYQGTRTFEGIGVGTNGDAAPMFGGGGGGSTPSYVIVNIIT